MMKQMCFIVEKRNCVGLYTVFGMFTIRTFGAAGFA